MVNKTDKAPGPTEEDKVKKQGDFGLKSDLTESNLCVLHRGSQTASLMSQGSEGLSHLE